MTFSENPALPDEARLLLQSATRRETPSGEGSLVWHLWGPESSPSGTMPVVLLHGGSGSWTHWLRNIAALLASGRRVLVPDLPGSGDSAMPPRGGDADALPEPLEQGLQILLGDSACELVGFSFGGMVAGFLAERFPARVARLMLVGAPGLGITPQPVISLRAWRHLPDAAERDAVHRGNLAALMLYRSEAISEATLRLHVANVVRDRMTGRRLSRTDALLRSLAQLRCPMHAIYGREDALYLGKLAALETALRQAGDFRGLAFIEEAGHWVQFEQAQAFNEALLAVLDRPR
ncbi:alpha/beta fold hydrolase [Polaromonas sp. OV174]|uniref:alpha/beta fold hydrolase n=1 Tax=Polaromonas sp. OV174 TaxID=1855300 RepID=UPI000B867798|nr:alpha/beta fold hydrolase [Polaromonas sp. OV174]